MGKAFNPRKMSLPELQQEVNKVEQQLNRTDLPASMRDAAVTIHKMLSMEIAIKQKPKWKRPFARVFRRK